MPLGVGEDGVYGTQDILDAALDLARHADRPEESAYYELYRAFMGNQGVVSYDETTRQTTFQEGPFFKLRIGSDLHEVRVLGICQDRLASPYADDDGATIGTAGLTFGWKAGYVVRLIDPKGTALINWSTCEARKYLNGTFLSLLPTELRAEQSGVKTVVKAHNASPGYADRLDETQDRIFIPSAYEIYGTTIRTIGWEKEKEINPMETAENSFQYHYFALGGIVPLDQQAFNLQACLSPEPGGLGGSFWCRSTFVARDNAGNPSKGSYAIGTNSDGTMWLPWSLNVTDGQLLPCFAI